MQCVGKKQFVGDLKPGDMVDSTFLLVEKESVRPYKRGFMFRATISDRTGSVPMVYFGDGDEDGTNQIWSSLKIGQLARVKGSRSDFNGRPQVTVNAASGLVEKEDGPYDEDDYITRSGRDDAEMRAELLGIIADVGDPEIRSLLEGFFNDDKFMERFATAPAAVTMHHNYRGGLLEHVLGMLKIARAVTSVHTELDKDYVVAGCILHDIGKIDSYAQEGMAAVYTDDGTLIGHISIGYKMVSDMMDGMIPPFPSDKRKKILHILLSHHGRLEWGSPVEPRMPEASAVHLVDNTDAKLKGIIQKQHPASQPGR